MRSRKRSPEVQPADTSSPALDDKLRYLRRPGSYPAPAPCVEPIETHMSWVFLSGETAYKLKKPVAYPFLDFSTLAAREADCRDELRLNRRLAPGVYLGLSRLQRDEAGRLALVDDNGAAAAAPAEVVDWLVRMRRLPADRTLARLAEQRAATPAQVEALGDLLAGFYGHLPPADLDAAGYLAQLRAQHRLNSEVLRSARFGLGDAALPVLAAVERFLDAGRELLSERIAAGRIVEGHGDLRPEHVFLLQPPVVIDCLEFSRELRLVDWADEIAFLGLECERLGAGWIGPALRARIGGLLADPVPDRLFDFYRALRALLRARLALAHLDEPAPRTPDHWLPLARAYLQLAGAAIDAPPA